MIQWYRQSSKWQQTVYQQTLEFLRQLVLQNTLMKFCQQFVDRHTFSLMAKCHINLYVIFLMAMCSLVRFFVWKTVYQQNVEVSAEKISIGKIATGKMSGGIFTHIYLTMSCTIVKFHDFIHLKKRSSVFKYVQTACIGTLWKRTKKN